MVILCPVFPEDLQAPPPTQPQETGAPNEQPLPYPWERIVHPEGDVVFYNHQDLVFTRVNLRQPGNAADVENAAQQIRQVLPAAHVPNEVHIVVGFTDEMQRRGMIGYYLVHHESHKIGWIQFMPQIFGFTPDIVRRCFESLRRVEYWKHIAYYPSRIAVDITAEHDLIAGLIAGQLGYVNHGMTPFSPEECRNHLSVVQQNQETQSDDRRMAEIGRLLALIHAYTHRNIYGVQQRIRRVRYGVDHVPRRAYVQPELLRLLEVWRRWLAERLADFELSFTVSCACSILLASINNFLGRSRLFTGALLITTHLPSPHQVFISLIQETSALLAISISATLLLRSKFPGVYSDMESFVMGVMPNQPLRNTILSCLLVFNILGYGSLLSSISQYLGDLDRVPSTVEAVMASLVLASLPVAYVIWADQAFPRANH